MGFLSRLGDALFFVRWSTKGLKRAVMPVAQRNGISEEEVDYAIRVFRLAFALRLTLIVAIGIGSAAAASVAWLQYLKMREQTDELIKQGKIFVEQNEISRTQVDFQRRTELLRIIYTCHDGAMDKTWNFCLSPEEAEPLRSMAIVEFVSLERKRIDQLVSAGQLATADEKIISGLRKGGALDPEWRSRAGIDCIAHPWACVQLHQINLNKLSFRGVDLSWVLLTNATLVQTSLIDVDFRGSQLRQSLLVGSYWRDVDGLHRSATQEMRLNYISESVFGFIRLVPPDDLVRSLGLSGTCGALAPWFGEQRITCERVSSDSFKAIPGIFQRDFLERHEREVAGKAN